MTDCHTCGHKHSLHNWQTCTVTACGCTGYTMLCEEPPPRKDRWTLDEIAEMVADLAYDKLMTRLEKEKP